MVGLTDTADDEEDSKDTTVWMVQYQMHGRACKISDPFIEEEAAEAFVDLLEANEFVTKARKYAYSDSEYVEKRENEPLEWDHVVRRI